MATSIIKTDEIRKLNDTVLLSNGVLSNNVQFPAGHIIQTTRNAYSAENSDSYSTRTMAIVNKSGVQSWSGTINNVQANSHVLINMGFSISAATSSRPDTGYSFGIYRESTLIYGIGTVAVDEYIYFSSTGSSSNQVNAVHHIQFMDTSPTTGTNNYYLGFISYASTSIEVRSKSSSGYKPFECILQEVAQ
tara:strand:+ start:858 stop:1430 length:573 start_codon:yes stop_codon:yes gene_type:complete